MGYVQIDAIAVIERAHHHTIWNRCPDYQPSFLNDLMAVDRDVFEHWAHAIAYLPMADFRFYMRRMEQRRGSESAWLREWKTAHPQVLDEVLERIRTEGALTSKDFEPPPGAKRGTWWDWKPAKRALEILFRQGDLLISARERFQKVYDLTERVLPEWVDTRVPSPEEAARFHVRRALRAYGLAQAGEIARTLTIASRPLIVRAIDELRSSGEVTRVEVDGLQAEVFALAEALEPEIETNGNIAHLLSPFDNLIIQRDRMKRMFDFDYTIECYVPPAKRKVGYFVLPILWKDRLIGRLDPKADRKTGTLLVKTLLFEPWFSDFDESIPSLADALASFARFNSCHAVTFDRIAPTGHKRRLKTLVRRALAGSV